MYLELFRLREKPFNATPDPNFLYMSPSHQEAFANLLYGIRERRGFIMVTGEVGTGKTTLLHNLLDSLEDEIQTVFIFHTGLDFTDLLEIVHEELGIPVGNRSRAGLLQSLNRYLIQQLQEERNVALIIDEAQNLSPEILENLRLLSNLETSKDKLLQIVLVGQPELEEKMAMPELRQLKQRISTASHIDALLPEEARAYILHRLSVAGAEGRPIFSDEAFNFIVRHSNGVPRQINILCDNAMLIAYAEGDRLVKEAHAREAVGDLFQRNGRKRQRTGSTPGLPIREGKRSRRRLLLWAAAVSLGLLFLVLLYATYQYGRGKVTSPAPQALPMAPPPSSPPPSNTSNAEDPANTATTSRQRNEDPRRFTTETHANQEPAAPAVSTTNPPPAAAEAQDDAATPWQRGGPGTVTPNQPTPGEAAEIFQEQQERLAQSAPPAETVAPMTPDYSLDPASPNIPERQAPVAEEVIVRPSDAPPLQQAFWRARGREALQDILDVCPRRVYVIQRGDTFTEVLFRETGRKDSQVIDLIEEMNFHIQDFNLIEPGWVFYLPDFEE